MYTAIIIIKILMHVLQPKLYRSINAVIYYYFPTPGMNENYVLCQQQYVLSRKYCWSYKSIFIHLNPMCWNNSVKMQIPMRAQSDYILHETPWNAPTGTPWATTSSHRSGPTNRRINELEYIFIGKQQFDAFTPLIHSAHTHTHTHTHTHKWTIEQRPFVDLYETTGWIIDQHQNPLASTNLCKQPIVL